MSCGCKRQSKGKVLTRATVLCVVPSAAGAKSAPDFTLLVWGPRDPAGFDPSFPQRGDLIETNKSNDSGRQGKNRHIVPRSSPALFPSCSLKKPPFQLGAVFVCPFCEAGSPYDGISGHADGRATTRSPSRGKSSASKRLDCWPAGALFLSLNAGYQQPRNSVLCNKAGGARPLSLNAGYQARDIALRKDAGGIRESVFQACSRLNFKTLHYALNNEAATAVVGPGLLNLQHLLPAKRQQAVGSRFGFISQSSANRTRGRTIHVPGIFSFPTVIGFRPQKYIRTGRCVERGCSSEGGASSINHPASTISTSYPY